MEEQSQYPPPAKLFKSDEQGKVIKLLEERLEKHDNNRKAVQDKLTEVLNKVTEQVDDLEDRINRELEEKFTSEEDRLQRALNELCGNSTISALQKAKVELYTIQSYDIIENKEANNDITKLYELKTERRTISEDGSVGLAISEMSSSIHSSPNATEMSETSFYPMFAEERERLIELLKERLEKHDNSRKAAQDKLHEILNKLVKQIYELEYRISKELEEKFTSEDDRLQTTLNELRGNRTASALQKVKAELLIEKLYEIIDNKDPKHDITTLYKLKTKRYIVPGLMEMRKPTNFRVISVNRGRVSVKFTFLNPDEERVLPCNTILNPVKFKCLLFKKGNEQESKEYPLDKGEGNDYSSFSFTFTPGILETETTYGTRVKMIVGNRESEWSDEVVEFTTPEFKDCCGWKKCPDSVDEDKKYIVDRKNPRIAIKIGYYRKCAIAGNTRIPPNTVTSWSVKILKSMKIVDDIYIGVAPFDIAQNDEYNDCGWYFDYYWSELYSGPPHKYDGKVYGPRKKKGHYVHTENSVGVVMDTTRGELSFVLNGVNFGAAYEGIPLDKPLVPCVFLVNSGESVELDTSEVKENVNIFIPVPSNIAVKSITCDSITLAWNKVSDASFYQVEVNGSVQGMVTKNLFTKGGFLAETGHSFRVRTVRGNSVSEWSSVVKGRTQKVPEFFECVWRECPGYVVNYRKYSVDGGNPRVATKVNGDYRFCTIIGNTYIPINTVTSWSIKILKSGDNNENRIFIGVAPFDINQNNGNYDKCGWYFDCYHSVLRSGPPHNYWYKEYGPRKEGNQYVHTGDSVGVVMDTTRGELSFVLNGVNRGAAYCGIPLDKPLVPCVLLKHQGDSIELNLSEIKTNQMIYM